MNAHDGSEHGTTAALRESWETNAPAWTQAVREGGIASRRLVTDRAIVDAVRARSPCSLLDVGCGEGWLCRALANDVACIVGADGSKALVTRARELGGAVFEHAAYVDLRDAPALTGERFDVIVANFSLLEEDLTGFLDTAAKLLEHGGTLLIQTVHLGSVAPPYRSGWRTEDFAAFDGGAGWQPMPWYFRTLSDWLAAFRPGWRIRDLIEPLHPETERPASLILTAERARS